MVRRIFRKGAKPADPMRSGMDWYRLKDLIRRYGLPYWKSYLVLIVMSLMLAAVTGLLTFVMAGTLNVITSSAACWCQRTSIESRWPTSLTPDWRFSSGWESRDRFRLVVTLVCRASPGGENLLSWDGIWGSWVGMGRGSPSRRIS
jgi:hypothetical protein